jgi:signal transduction histidine kinase
LLRRKPEAADALLADLSERTQSAVDDIRRLVYALRPPALDELGLVGAVRQHSDQFLDTGLQVDIDAPEPLPTLPAAVEVAAFRIVSEAIANAARHAGARRCRVGLRADRSAGVLRMVVGDDGRGLSEGRPVGVGLVSMRERAEELGGSWEIDSTPGGGTTIRVRLPLADSAVARGPFEGSEAP